MKKAKATELQKQYSIRRKKEIQRAEKRYYERQDKQNAKIENKRRDFYKGEYLEVIDYLYAVFANDCITIDYYDCTKYDMKMSILDFQNENEKLSIQIRIPNSDEICTIKYFQLSEQYNEPFPIEYDKKLAIKQCLYVAYGIMLRAATLVITSDAQKWINEVTITGFLEYYDRAFGNYTALPVIKISISKELLHKINLERIDITTLFEKKLAVKKSTGLYEKDPIDLKSL